MTEPLSSDALYNSYPDVIFDEDGNTYSKPRYGTIGFTFGSISRCTECNKILFWCPLQNRLPPHMPFCSKECVESFSLHDIGGRR